MLLVWRAFSLAIVALALGLLAAGVGRTQEGGHAARLTINGAIGPAVADYIHRGLDKAVDGGATVVILQMDTPGGLDTSMRAIIKDILAAPVPVIGYVGPPGARAASAGTYMLYASHVAAMAPATNLGAATPVQLGGGGEAPPKEPAGKKPEDDKDDSDSDADKSDEENDDKAEEKADEKAKDDKPRGKPGMQEKVLNDAVAYIRSLAQKRGRNVEWAEKAVTEAASLSAEDALAEGVIDYIAETPAEILEKANGRTVEVAGDDRVLKTAGLSVVDLAPDWRTEFLEIITDPTVAYLLLFTIGIPALMIELYTGTVIAGVIGAVCILLGLYGLHVLPVNYAGVALILLGFALLVTEAFVPSFGVLGIGGVVSFVIGSVMLIDTDVPGFGVSPWAIGAVASTAAMFMLLIITMLIRSRQQPVVSGQEAMIGGSGTVIDWTDGGGRVRYQGVIWRARSEGEQFDPGAPIRVHAREGLTLIVGNARPPADAAEQES